MRKPDGICIYPKNDDFDKAYFVRTTDIMTAIQYFISEYGYGYDLGDLIIQYFYDAPWEYEYTSDPFELE